MFDPVQDIQSERVFDFSIDYYNKLSLLPNITLLSVKEYAEVNDPYHSITAGNNEVLSECGRENVMRIT